MKAKANKRSVPSASPRGLFDQMAEPLVKPAAVQSEENLASEGRYTEAIRYLSRVDKVLARLIKRVGPCTLEIEKQVKPYEALVEAIVYQQLHAKAAAAILGRVKQLFSTRRFPRPDDFLGVPEDHLRAAGLSRGKIAAIVDLSAKVLAGVVPTARAIRRMSDEEIIQRLVAVRGIGRWTVEMLLLFSLGRPDVLPGTDYGVRQGFAITYNQPELPSPGDLIKHGERWKPHRSVAAWVLMAGGGIGSAATSIAKRKGMNSENFPDFIKISLFCGRNSDGFSAILPSYGQNLPYKQADKFRTTGSGARHRGGSGKNVWHQPSYL